MSARTIILGAGGHARVVAATLRAMKVELSGCVANEPPKGPWPKNVPYLGTDDVLKGFAPSDTLLVNGIGSVRTTELRKQTFDMGRNAGFRFVTVVHPQSIVDESVALGEGAQIMAGAVIQCGARIGENVLINTGSIVDHDCVIGAHSHLAPGVCLSGSVTIGSMVHVGNGAAIIQGVMVGDGVFIAAGAAVTSDVIAGAALAGVPARPMPQH